MGKSDPERNKGSKWWEWIALFIPYSRMAFLIVVGVFRFVFRPWLVVILSLGLGGCAYTRHCYNITENIGREPGNPKEELCVAQAEFEKNIYWQYIREFRWL